MPLALSGVYIYNLVRKLLSLATKRFVQDQGTIKEKPILMIKRLRDKSRDDLARNLNSFGVAGVLAERGRWEEKIEKFWYLRSLGIIDITGGVIKWANIWKKDGSKNSPPQWWVIFGVPDSRQVPGYKLVNIRTIRKKAFPLFGKVIGVTWRGDDASIGLIDILTHDQEIENLLKNKCNLTIKNYTEQFQGWTIKVDRWINPTAQDWSIYQKIAKLLFSYD